MTRTILSIDLSSVSDALKTKLGVDIFTFITVRGGVRYSEIVRHFEIKSGNVAYYIRKLRKAELIRATKQSDYKTGKVYSITSKGEKIIQKISEIMGEFESNE